MAPVPRMTTLPLVAGTIVETAVCFPLLNTYGVSVPVYAAGELTHGLRVPDPPPMVFHSFACN